MATRGGTGTSVGVVEIGTASPWVANDAPTSTSGRPEAARANLLAVWRELHARGTKRVPSAAYLAALAGRRREVEGTRVRAPGAAIGRRAAEGSAGGRSTRRRAKSRRALDAEEAEEEAAVDAAAWVGGGVDGGKTAEVFDSTPRDRGRGIPEEISTVGNVPAPSDAPSPASTPLSYDESLTWTREYGASEWQAARRSAPLLDQRESNTHGWGLFAAQPVPAGTLVIEYVGELVGNEEADRREKLYEADGTGTLYLFRLHRRAVIDATWCGNAARFINHSCEPNCVSTNIFVRTRDEEGGGKMGAVAGGEGSDADRARRAGRSTPASPSPARGRPPGSGHVAIFSKRAIEAGEELAYDYMFELEPDKEAVPCCCGASACRGRMN